jgi:peptidoglycan hydrolase-like protein with peptidoglycan-binding domain
MVVVANSLGNTVLTICQSGSQCGTFNITVATPAPSTTSASVISTPVTTTVSSPISTNYIFTSALGLGSTGTEVTQLQNKLISLGYYNGSATGYYGSLTEKAVKTFQAAKGIAQLGTVGPQTRAALNGNSTATVSTTNSSHIFTKPLDLGSQGSEVTALQEKLTSLGYYKGPVNGSYGPLTKAAVKTFQKAVGLLQLGNVGPGTRAALNSR